MRKNPRVRPRIVSLGRLIAHHSDSVDNYIGRPVLAFWPFIGDQLWVTRTDFALADCPTRTEDDTPPHLIKF